ncbi:MAG: hypothetical protein R3F62_26725 [Planctomycetota bacterium]
MLWALAIASAAVCVYFPLQSSLEQRLEGLGMLLLLTGAVGGRQRTARATFAFSVLSCLAFTLCWWLGNRQASLVLNALVALVGGLAMGLPGYAVGLALGPPKLPEPPRPKERSGAKPASLDSAPKEARPLDPPRDPERA